jgi:hypothetical protein
MEEACNFFRQLRVRVAGEDSQRVIGFDHGAPSLSCAAQLALRLATNCQNYMIAWGLPEISWQRSPALPNDNDPEIAGCHP